MGILFTCGQCTHSKQKWKVHKTSFKHGWESRPFISPVESLSLITQKLFIALMESYHLFIASVEYIVNCFINTEKRRSYSIYSISVIQWSCLEMFINFSSFSQEREAEGYSRLQDQPHLCCARRLHQALLGQDVHCTVPPEDQSFAPCIGGLAFKKSRHALRRSEVTDFLLPGQEGTGH